MRDKDHWTAEEYREFQRTGREPIRAPKPAEGRKEREQTAREFFSNVYNAFCESKANVEQKWAEAEKRGEIMTLEIPSEPETPKKRKYRNEPIVVDGIRFDSKHEAAVYGELMQEVQTGQARCVMRQVGFDLPGKIRYFADFVVIRPDYTVEVIDAKSEITRKNRTYINKKKQVKALWGIDIIER